MEKLLYLVPLIGCAAACPAMMWFMMRSRKSAQPGQQGTPAPPAAREQQIAALRAEVERLRADRADARATGQEGSRAGSGSPS